MFAAGGVRSGSSRGQTVCGLEGYGGGGRAAAAGHRQYLSIAQPDAIPHASCISARQPETASDCATAKLPPLQSAALVFPRKTPVIAAAVMQHQQVPVILPAQPEATPGLTWQDDHQHGDCFTAGTLPGASCGTGTGTS